LHYPYRFYWCGKASIFVNRIEEEGKAQLRFDKKYITDNNLDAADIKVWEAKPSMVVLSVKVKNGLTAAEDQHTQASSEKVAKEYISKYECKKSYSMERIHEELLIQKDMLTEISKQCTTSTRCHDTVAYDALETRLEEFNANGNVLRTACKESELYEEEQKAVDDKQKKKIDILLSILKIGLAAVPLGNVLEKIGDLAEKIIDIAQTVTEEVIEVGRAIGEISELNGDIDKLKVKSAAIYAYKTGLKMITQVIKSKNLVCGGIRDFQPNSNERKAVCGKSSSAFVEISSIFKVHSHRRLLGGYSTKYES